MFVLLWLPVLCASRCGCVVLLAVSLTVYAVFFFCVVCVLVCLFVCARSIELFVLCCVVLLCCCMPLLCDFKVCLFMCLCAVACLSVSCVFVCMCSWRVCLCLFCFLSVAIDSGVVIVLCVLFWVGL